MKGWVSYFEPNMQYVIIYLCRRSVYSCSSLGKLISSYFRAVQRTGWTVTAAKNTCQNSSASLISKFYLRSYSVTLCISPSLTVSLILIIFLETVLILYLKFLFYPCYFLDIFYHSFNFILPLYFRKYCSLVANSERLEIDVVSAMFRDILVTECNFVPCESVMGHSA